MKLKNGSIKDISILQSFEGGYSPLKFISIGHANIDITLFVPKLPPPDGDVKVLTSMVGTGGAASNFAICVTKLGEEAGLLAVVGDDLLGKFFIDKLEELGVDVSNIEIAKGASTGMVVVLNEIGKQRRMVSISGANAKMDSKTIEKWSKVISEADFVHIASLEIENALAVAKRRRDLSWDPGTKVVRLGLKKLDPMFGSVRRILLNKEEAKILAGKEEIKETLRFISDLGPTEVIVKLGERGSIALVEGTFYEVPALSPLVVDTTGAGDVFDATYLVARARNYGVKDSLKLANAASALKISRPGTTTGIPTWSEVLVMASAFYGT